MWHTDRDVYYRLLDGLRKQDRQAIVHRHLFPDSSHHLEYISYFDA